LPPIPLQGLDSATLIRNIIDFDAWLAMSRMAPGVTLQATRAAFWQAVRAQGGCNFVEDKAVVTYMLPIDLKNSIKIPVTSEGFLHPVPVPCLIPPICEETEELIISSLLNEINEEFGLGLNASPDFNRILIPTPLTAQAKPLFWDHPT